MADDPVQIFGVTLVGVSRTTGVKLLFTLALIVVVLLLRFVVLRGVRRVLGGDVADPRRFWALAFMRSRYALADASLQPAVYWRITDSWLEQSLRSLVPQRRGSRDQGRDES